MDEREYFRPYVEKYGPQGEQYALMDIRVSDNDPERIEKLLSDLAEMRDTFRGKNYPIAAGYLSEAISDLMAFQGMLYRMRDWVKPPRS